jgi:hypothetical protein
MEFKQYLTPVIGILCASLFVGCEERVEKYDYKLCVYNGVPDSLKQRQEQWITNTVKAASERMSTSDYEHPEDLVEEVTDQSFALFSREMGTSYRLREFGRCKNPMIYTACDSQLVNEIKKSGGQLRSPISCGD